MAATEPLLTWSGLAEHAWSEEEEQESMATMRARLLAMTWASQAKDAALEDLQRRLKAALEQAEQGRTREAALLRRAEKSEEAEEALASQMADVEAEAFIRITETNRLLAAEPLTTSQLSIQIKGLQARLQTALEEAATWARRCEVLGEEVKEGRVREATLQRRAEMAEEAEESLASQMAEVEAEAFRSITESTKLVDRYKRQERNTLLEEGIEGCDEEARPIESRREEELERRLAGAEEALKAVNVKLRQAEERNRSLEERLGEEGKKGVTLKRKQGEDTLLSLPLQDLAGFVKLKLWNPSSLTLITSPS